jgi:hypothetical protein
MSDTEIQAAIENYLRARHALLEMGRRYPSRIGGNDNIPGRIGEFLALRFLEKKLRQQPSKVTQRSNPGYDLIDKKRKLLTQVKVITAENETGCSMRLKGGWDQFLLIQLGENYQPNRIGVLTAKQHKQARTDNPGWSSKPRVKLTMLGGKGLIGRYGTVFHGAELGL